MYAKLRAPSLTGRDEEGEEEEEDGCFLTDY
jgi:hypothetical protein